MPNNCSVANVVKIEVRPYLKADGWKTKYWGVYVDGSLLGLTVYKKGALAIAALLNELHAEMGNLLLEKMNLKSDGIETQPS